MKILLFVVGGIAAALGAFLAMLYWRQERLIFYPEPLPADYAFAEPDVVELPVSVDGARLSALHLRLPDPKGIVFFLHGNGGNLSTWFVNTAFYRQANYDLFMVDYRGYGKSSGRIESEVQLRSDVMAAWTRIAPMYQERRKVILGRSLGTALATGLAAQVQPDLTILVSSYWSMTEMARIYHPYVPAVFLRYRLETFRDIASIAGPVLLLHGEQDELIPVAHSARLQALVRAAQFVPIAGAAHNDLQDFAEYRDAVSERLARL